MSTDCSQQLTFWEMGTQQVTVDFAGGRVVTDTGLLPIRLLDKELGVLAWAAQTSSPSLPVFILVLFLPGRQQTPDTAGPAAWCPVWLGTTLPHPSLSRSRTPRSGILWSASPPQPPSPRAFW